MDNTVITLFGGLAGVLVLYAVGSLVRLPAILRAVLAGLIPLFAYFVYIVGHWPGLDVVAIHISVFFATALVLFALTLFRRRGGRMHWVPKLLMSFFVGLAVLMGAFLYIANNGLPEPIGRAWLGSKTGGPVYSGFSGVVPHNQEAATAISSELSKRHREAALGWNIDVSGLDGSGLVRTVRVRVRDQTGLPVDGVEAELRLGRPGATLPELTVPLIELDGGVYGGTVHVPANGRWLAELRLSRDRQLRYQHTRELEIP